MQTVKLGEIVDVKKGKKPEVVLGAPCDGSRPCILIDEVRGNVPTNFTTDAKGVEVSKNDICIIWDGANAGTIGFGVEGLIGSTVARLRIISQNRWDTRFVGRLLQGQFQSINAAAHGKGATIPHVDKRHLEEIEFPVYSLEEQKRIAAILDQADDIRRKRQHAIDRLNQLGQAIFHDMFECSDSSVWPIADLADVVRDGTIVTYGIVQAGDEYPGGIPYIRTGDIKDGQIVTTGLRHTSPEIASKFERSRVREGEIVMSIRATVGTVAFVPPALDGANLTQGTARISPGDRTNPKYLIEFFKSPSVQNWIAKQVKGATFREITLSRLRELPVRIPPMDLQSRFSSMMTQIDEQKQAHAQASALAELAFASLQHRAFTGQL